MVQKVSLLCLREVLWRRPRGTQGLAGAGLFCQGCLCWDWQPGVVTFELVLIPGHGQNDKATHSWAGLCWPLFLSGKQLRETQTVAVAAPVTSLWTKQAPLTFQLPKAWLSACPALQKLGLTQEEELATPFFTLSWWYRWMVRIEMKGF